jgi:putative exporter of polyketide antibiotics
MATVEVKFGDWIQKGFDLYKDNLATLILVNLLAVVISVFTVGILAGPMAVGVILVTLALLDKQQPAPQVGDVFKGFSYFLPSFLFCIAFLVVMMIGSFILGMIPCLGQILSLLFTYGLQALVMFALFNIADKKMDVVPAVQASIEVVKLNFWPFLGFAIVAAVLGSVGAIACGIGIVVTLPLYYCILAVAYREVGGSVATPPSLG